MTSRSFKTFWVNYNLFSTETQYASLPSTHFLSQMGKLGGAWLAGQVWWLFYEQSHWQWAKRHLICGVALVRRKADIQSFVLTSLMAGLVARAISCLGHVK